MSAGSDDDRRGRLAEAPSDRWQWDWVTIAVMLVIAVILALVTFDFWLSRSN